MANLETVRQFVASVTGLPISTGTPEARDLLETISEDVFATFHSRFAQATLPKPGETVGITRYRQKTAALLFDRVWYSPILTDQPPEDIRVNGATEIELLVQAMFYLY